MKNPMNSLTDEDVSHGEPVYRLATPELDLCLSIRGGQLAPVVFHLPTGDVSPYALAPWQPAEFGDLPPLLSVLRGDFFCLPFGPQDAGPPHGAPANHAWALAAQGERDLQLTLHASDSGARIEKFLSVRPGHHAVYCEHRIGGLEGPFSYGNHPILDLSAMADGGGRVSTSAIRWASVYPGLFSDPARGESQALLGGARFDALREVPLAAGGTADLSRYPARPGHDDLVMLVNQPACPAQPFAWSAVVMDGYVWFALKNPVDFPATLLWMSNGGRSAEPWNDRHTGRLGVEEVCSYFCDPVTASREDRLAEDGIPTTRRFQRDQTVSLRTVQAAAAVPADFGAVVSIRPAGPGLVALQGESGGPLTVAVDWDYPLDRSDRVGNPTSPNIPA
jgi:hypothetical protein